MTKAVGVCLVELMAHLQHCGNFQLWKPWNWFKELLLEETKAHLIVAKQAISKSSAML